MARTRIRFSGQLLKKLRIDHGFMTQEALANASGVGLSTIGRIENHRDWEVNGSTIVCFALAFKMEEEELIHSIGQFDERGSTSLAKPNSAAGFERDQQQAAATWVSSSRLAAAGPVQDRVRRAIVSYALQADDNPEARDALRGMRQYGEAVGLLRLIDRDLAVTQERFRDLHLKRAALCIMVGKTNEAKQSVAEVLTLTPHDADALLLDAAIRRIGGDFDKAITACRQLLRIVEGETRLDTLLLLGRIYGDLSQYDQVASVASDGLRQAEALGDTLKVAEAHAILAMNHRRQVVKEAGQRAVDKLDLMPARLHWVAALRTYRSDDDKVGLVTVLDNIATGHITIGNWRRAGRIYERLIAKNRLLRRRPGMATAYGNLCLVRGHMGDYRGAIDSAYRAARIFRRIGWPENVARTEGNIANCYTLWERRSLAVKHWKKAKTLFEELGMTAQADACVQNLKALAGAEQEPPFMA